MECNVERCWIDLSSRSAFVVHNGTRSQLRSFVILMACRLQLSHTFVPIAIQCKYKNTTFRSHFIYLHGKFINFEVHDKPVLLARKCVCVHFSIWWQMFLVGAEPSTDQTKSSFSWFSLYVFDISSFLKSQDYGDRNGKAQRQWNFVSGLGPVFSRQPCRNDTKIDNLERRWVHDGERELITSKPLQPSTKPNQTGANSAQIHFRQTFDERPADTEHKTYSLLASKMSQ